MDENEHRESTKQMGNVNETLEILCDSCKNENEYVPAVGFCIECKEHLCSICLRVHSRLMATKQHSVKAMHAMLKERKGIDGSGKVKCTIHVDKDMNFYCKQHTELSCMLCNSIIHSSCIGVENVSDICDQIDLESEMKKLQVQLDDLQRDVGKTSHLIEVSLDAVKLNHDVAKSYLTKVRKEVNEHLDEIENKIHEKIDEFKKSDSDKMKKYGRKCKALTSEIESTKNDLKTKMKANEKYQAFMTMKSAESFIRSSRYDLYEIRRNNSVNRYTFHPNDQLLKLRTDLKTFGYINEYTGAFKTAKLVNSLNVKTESDHQCEITAITILEDNKIVVIDKNNKSIKLIETAGNKILSTAVFDSSPWGIARVESVFAVTLPVKQTIAKVVLNENVLHVLRDRHNIKVDGQCYGIAAYDGKLIVTFSWPSKIEMFDKCGKSLRLFKTSIQPMYIEIDTARACMFITNGGSDKIKQLFFSDPSCKKAIGIEYCKSMAMDSTGVLLYISTDGIMACRFSEDREQSSVIGFSEYADDIKPISTRLFQISNAKSLAFYNRTNVLFVGLAGNELQMYTIV